MGFSISFGSGGTAGKSCGAGVVCVEDVDCMSLIVFLYTYKRKLAEDGGFGGELQVKLVCNCPDEVVYCLVDLFGRRVGGRGMEESIKLVKLEGHLLLVASPSVELAGAGNGGNVGEVR